jgi:hypothetical protein
MQRISLSLAVTVGTLWINIPVLCLLLSPIIVYALLLGPEGRRPGTANDLIAVVALLLLGFLAAWLWWSVMIPRWRLWAWSRVESIPELKRRAVGAGLIWPEGHFFERTEFRTQSTEKALRDLEHRDAEDI